jgi:serine/threonine-protein kinase
MTLAYASPEQVRGEPVSTVSDVYSLGLILYELLVGAHPYRHELTGPAVAVSVVSQVVPPPPSDLAVAPSPQEDPGNFDPNSAEARAKRRGTVPSRLKRNLTGDLDTIVLKALRKEPERRYASVADLSADLRAYRNRLPVSAHPDSWTYRAGRFLQRNRFTVTLGAVALLLTVGQVTVALRAAARDREQALIIQREASRAEAVTDFLVGLFEFTDSQDGMADTIRARTLVDRGADRILASLKDQPETKVQILGALSKVYENLGLPDQELGLLEEALDLSRVEGFEDDLQEARYLERIADAHRGNRNFDQAAPYFREALEIYRRNSADPLVLAQATLNFAATLSGLGQADSALALNAEGVRIRRRELGDEALSTLRAVSDRGMIFRAAGEPDSARAIYEKVLPVLRQKGDSAVYLLSSVLNNEGYLLRTQNDMASAEAFYREALGLERELNLPIRLTTVLSNLATVLENQGKLEETESALAERIEVTQETWPEGHWRVGSAEGALALFYLRHERPAEALPHARKQLESYRVQIAEEHSWTNQARVLLGISLLELERFEEAEPYLLHAYGAFVDQVGVEHDQTQELIRRLVTLYEGMGNPEEANRYRRLRKP